MKFIIHSFLPFISLAVQAFIWHHVPSTGYAIPAHSVVGRETSEPQGKIPVSQQTWHSSVGSARARCEKRESEKTISLHTLLKPSTPFQVQYYTYFLHKETIVQTD